MDLSHNEISYRGGLALVGALQDAVSRLHGFALNVNENQFNSTDAISFASSIAGTPILAKLVGAGDSVGFRVARAVQFRHTNQVEVLSFEDEVIKMDGGCAGRRGTYVLRLYVLEGNKCEKI